MKRPFFLFSHQKPADETMWGARRTLVSSGTDGLGFGLARSARFGVFRVAFSRGTVDIARCFTGKVRSKSRPVWMM
jgi:hypothetical protein